MSGEMAGSRGSALVARKSTFSMKRPALTPGAGTAGRATAADGIGRGDDGGVVGIVHGVDAIVPVVAAEGTAGQAHLHDVVELAVAGVDLDLAVVQQVIGAADAGGDLVAPAELHGGEAGGIVGRLHFVVEADAEVQGEAVADLPGILEVDRLGGLRGTAGVDHAGADDEVSVAALAGRHCRSWLRFWSLDGIAGRGAGDRRVVRAADVEIDGAAVEGFQNIVGLGLIEEAALERVRAAEVADEVGRIDVDALALVRVIGGGQVAGMLAKPLVLTRAAGIGRAGQIDGGCGNTLRIDEA